MLNFLLAIESNIFFSSLIKLFTKRVKKLNVVIRIIELFPYTCGYRNHREAGIVVKLFSVEPAKKGGSESHK